MERYDLILTGGHVIDPADGVDGPHDLAIRDGRVARLAPHLTEAAAEVVIDAAGLVVTPGLIDMHLHCFAGNDRYGLHADAHAFASGVTTVVDAGSAGWRNLGRFRSHVVDGARCRVLAFLNIVGAGMEDQPNEQNLDDMDVAATAAGAAEHADLIVGIKTAHYRQPGWGAPDRALAAAEQAHLPAMVDVEPLPGHPYTQLLTRLRPDDIATHMYGAHLPTVTPDGRVYDYIWQARERGVRFDVGHGAGSFAYRVAVPCLARGFGPDAISTDLHRMNINGPVFSMLTTVSKFLNLGLSLSEVIARATVHPARLIGRPELGTLAEGAVADVAIFALHQGAFGYWDSDRRRMNGDRALACRLTLRAGAVVYDPDGLTLPDWRRQ